MEQSEINYLKTELVNDLIATTTVMEELWRYHPENQDKKNVVSEYEVLKRVKEDIEEEMKKLEN
jgi:cell division protein FtsB